ncbi:MAG: hypothetical protein ACJ74O_02815 [Frankiaceae bacterium]
MGQRSQHIHIEVVQREEPVIELYVRALYAMARRMVAEEEAGKRRTDAGGAA